MQVDVSVISPKWDDGLADAASIATRAIGAAVSAAGSVLHPASEVSVVLADDELQRRLNRQWRGRDDTTNVLAFPLRSLAEMSSDAKPALPGPGLGDIVLSYSVVCREAARDGKSIGDHVAHLIVHGCLHLLGFDHQDDAQAEAMENLERQALAALGIADPYVLNVPDLPEIAGSHR